MHRCFDAVFEGISQSGRILSSAPAPALCFARRWCGSEALACIGHTCLLFFFSEPPDAALSETQSAASPCELGGAE